MDASADEQASPLKAFVLTYIMPEKCYEHFFHHHNFAHVPCLKVVMSKLVGMWILASLLAPLAQIFKLLWASSSQGLSLVSALLDLLVVSVHVAYCIHQNFPIGAWGESVFLLIQLTLVAFLILCYRTNSIRGGAFLGVYAGFMYLLTSPLTPRAAVSAVQEWSVLVVITSRLSQVGCNASCGSTGQLSGLSVSLMFLASLGRVFSSMQDSGHSLHTQAWVLASCCSAVLLLQVLLYPADAETQKNRESEKKKKKQ